MSDKVSCPVCERPMKPKHTKGTDFMPFHHNREGARCAGTGDVVNAKPVCEDCGTDYCPKLSDPAPTVEAMDDVNNTGTTEDNHSQADPEKGPWFGAMYDGECSECDGAIYEGDRIRADGLGGYECEDCGSFEPAPAHPYAAIEEPPAREITDVQLPTADEFMSPSPVSARAVAEHIAYGEPMTPDEFMSSSPVGDADPIMSVSGQPKHVLRDHLDRYCVVLPGETELELFKSSGNPVGRTRATTFIKAASNSKAINDWGKRNVLIGAARRRDLVLQANGLTHENDRDRLEYLVRQLEEAAGSKVGSDLGTYLHEFTEYMDAGLKTWQDAPEEFQRSLALYAQALADAGLEPIRSLIERTTIIREYGWICGTFDRIFFHRPSGQYVIGDLKTGKTMDYGKNEIEAQLWTYAHGVNQNGIYDWNARTWQYLNAAGGSGAGGMAYDLRGVGGEVSETVGVVIHMPVQGPLEGTVQLLWADLENGAEHAATCAEVRARAGGKMKPWGDGPAPLAPELIDTPLTWEQRFGGVESGEQATALWREAKAAGVEGIRLNELIEIARSAIAKAVAERGY